jgi:pyruvate formate lyase activating enzyme
MTVAQVLAEIRKDRIFHEDCGGGATFSGGEPLMQPRFLMELLHACRAEGIATALDTSGYAPREEVLAAAALADLVLYDLKTMDDARHLRYTGVSNSRILENLRALAQVHANIWIRMPIIPGCNDSAEEIEAAAEFVTLLPGVRKVCLLPYHTTAAAKFARLGREYALTDVRPPTREELEGLAEVFRNRKLETTIGF